METIYFRLNEPSHELPVCASKFWGDADLPKDMPYPSLYNPASGTDEPYHFVCQLNLTDLPAPSALPAKGLLQFYANIHYYLADWDAEPEIGSMPSPPEAVKVLYFPDASPQKFEKRILTDDTDKGVRLFPQELALLFSSRLSLEEPQHHLLGIPEFRAWEDWDKPCQGWRLLLQIDSFEGADFNLLFMDEGVLDFLISEEDLRRCRFNNVRAVILSS